MPKDGSRLNHLNCRLQAQHAAIGDDIVKLTGNIRIKATRVLDYMYCAARVFVLMYYFPFLSARETARVRGSIKRPRETSSIILAARAEDPAFRDRNSIARKHGAGVYYGKSVLSRFDGAGYNFRRGVADRRRRAARTSVSVNEIFTLSARRGDKLHFIIFIGRRTHDSVNCLG
jgi:hypothetical protein